MNKTKSINRLYFCLILWAIVTPYLLWRPLYQMSAAQSSVAGEVLFAIPVALYLLIKRIRIWEWIPFRIIDLGTIFMAILTGLLLLPLVSFINVCSMMFATNYVSESSSAYSGNSFWLNLLVIAVIPAIVEELIYRGIFYHAYREKGVILGALASAIVFGIMHRNLNQFFYAAVLGLFFCALVEITGSIYASMAAHFAINGWNVVLMKLSEVTEATTTAAATESVQTELTADVLLTALILFGIVAVFTTMLAVAVMIWMTKHCKREPHMRWCFRRHKLPEGVSRNFVTPSFAIGTVIALIYMVLIEIL
jgi:hypothetical protein